MNGANCAMTSLLPRSPTHCRLESADLLSLCFNQLWIYAANFDGLRHATNAQHIRGNAHGDFPVEMDLQNIAERRFHNTLKAVVNILRIPE
jgi:hypothetical protein